MKIKHLICHILLFAYLLGVKDGFIALWKDDIAEPLRVFPYRADSLPPEDQKALSRGIKFDKKEDLLAILEDYLS